MYAGDEDVFRVEKVREFASFVWIADAVDVVLEDGWCGRKRRSRVRMDVAADEEEEEHEETRKSG